jgi:hypothetical protein
MESEEAWYGWRKLHIAVDTHTHEIIAAELSLSNVADTEVLPNLLKQTHRKIHTISGDGAYDTRECQAVTRRQLEHEKLQCSCRRRLRHDQALNILTRMVNRCTAKQIELPFQQ